MELADTCIAITTAIIYTVLGILMYYRSARSIRRLYLDFQGDPRFVGFAIVRGNTLDFDVADPKVKNVCIVLDSPRWFLVAIGSRRVYLVQPDSNEIFMCDRLNWPAKRSATKIIQQVDIPS